LDGTLTQQKVPPMTADNKKPRSGKSVPNDTLILSTEQAARFLNISVVTLERWRGKKSRMGPPFVRLGLRRVGYLRGDLENYTRSNRNRDVGSDEAA